MNAGTETATRPVRLLIVDDEPANREVLEIILLREGYVIGTAATGEEALAAVAADAPDLILLDLMMPEISGYEVAARLKGNLATTHIPILMITALSDSATRRRALSVGAAELLTKPLDRTELCQRVRELLRLETVAV